jgi:hypothetical protein
MSVIESKFNTAATTPSDINEHLPTLYKYALECSHITECGGRGNITSYAFANALKANWTNKLIQIELADTVNVQAFQLECKSEGVNTIFYNLSDLECPIEQTDMLFIDTWHVYGKLKRELARWNNSVTKYIIMHDTTVDEWVGETIRMNLDAVSQSKHSGIPIDEIKKGLWPAIGDFLKEHPEWTIKERFTNNHGLTILERKLNMAFYTCFYGSNKNIAFQIPPIPSTKYDCYYFTNNRLLFECCLNYTNWIPVFENKPTIDDLIESNMTAKHVKVCPQDYEELKKYDYLCFLDSKLTDVSEDTLCKFLNTNTYPVCMREHPYWGGDVWREYNISMGQPRYALEKDKYLSYINSQVSAGLNTVTPTHFACGMIIRNMKDPKTIEINKTWYEHIQQCGIQDQISFFFVKQLFEGYIGIA